ncbi:unnamed protein product, partial [Allacma fusca]
EIITYINFKQGLLDAWLRIRNNRNKLFLLLGHVTAGAKTLLVP